LCGRSQYFEKNMIRAEHAPWAPTANTKAQRIPLNHAPVVPPGWRLYGAITPEWRRASHVRMLPINSAVPFSAIVIAIRIKGERMRLLSVFPG